MARIHKPETVRARRCGRRYTGESSWNEWLAVLVDVVLEFIF